MKCNFKVGDEFTVKVEDIDGEIVVRTYFNLPDGPELYAAFKEQGSSIDGFILGVSRSILKANDSLAASGRKSLTKTKESDK